MNIIKIGSQYRIYDDDIKTFASLPPNTYRICFGELSGFFLEEAANLEVKEKVYGVHEEKAEKVLRSFKLFDRNLGVILSGAKGIGKSLFASMLCIRAQQNGIPVILVDRYFSGIAQYIDGIKQEVLFLFDEFDKTFGQVKQKDGEADAQTSMLSLFDGTSSGKKLFVVTCNSLYNISDFLVNRPGRFHYHFRFDYPTNQEIKDYFADHLNPEYLDQVEQVIKFSNRVPLNYDCLRAIAFELNTGEPFKCVIDDLNIINNQNIKYEMVLYYPDGTSMSNRSCFLDLFGEDINTVGLYDYDYDELVSVSFNAKDAIYDIHSNKISVPVNKIMLSYYSEDTKEAQKVEKLKKMNPIGLSIRPKEQEKYRFALTV